MGHSKKASEEVTYDVIIIGAGPAGMTAAVYAVRKGLQALVVAKEIGGQVMKSGEVENYLGFGSSTGYEVAAKFHEHIDQFENLNHIDGVAVTAVEKKDDIFLVKTDHGIFSGRTVIIASGRSPRHLNVPGEREFTNKGITYCDVCDGPLFKGKPVAVVGGGNSALEAALSLARLSSSVIILNLTGELTGDEILREKVNKAKNITVINNAKTTRINGNKLVTGLTYIDNDGKEQELSAEGIFIEIGYGPSVSFDTLTKKDSHNRIIITNECETSVPGIFAAGDVSSVRDNQIIVAAGEGAKSALSAYYYLSKR